MNKQSKYTITLKVTENEIRPVGTNIVPTKSIDSQFAHFIFDESWDEFARFAVFKTCDGTPIHMFINTDGDCLIPYEVLDREDIHGFLEVGVYGTGDGKRITTNFCKGARLTEGAYSQIDTEQYTPTDMDQMLTEIRKLQKTIEDFQEPEIPVDLIKELISEILENGAW